MHLPSHDVAPEDVWRPFLAANPFGHLVAGGRDRQLPVVVPTQFLHEVVDGADVVLLHLVRTNPLLAAVAENPRVVLSVAGDWAYVPSSWKAIGDEDPALGIPTTYYLAVQLIGTATLVDDPEEVAGILRRQLGAVQPDVPVVDPAEHGSKLRAITGIRIAVDEVRAKAKYGGNVDVEHRRAIAERLRHRGGPGDLAAASHVDERPTRQAVLADIADLPPVVLEPSAAEAVRAERDGR